MEIPIPEALLPEIRQYILVQRTLLLERARVTFAESLGTTPEVYSVAQLHIDAAMFAAGLALGSNSAGLAAAVTSRARELAALLRSLFERALSPAHAQTQNCPPAKKGEILGEGCSGGGGPNEPFMPPEIPRPPGCEKLSFSNIGHCQPTEDHCEALPSHKVVQTDAGPFCVPKRPPTDCPKNGMINPFVGGSGNVPCNSFPLKPKRSVDPNDKAGRDGPGAARYLAGQRPMTYTVFFENLPSATAPAQEVIITDQLDTRLFDLSTFSLGPMAFGAHTVIPAPGMVRFTGGVDLRPEQDEIVSISASLDPGSGIVTWRFRSLDPTTAQFTDDPDVGFLPPNTNPPHGEGSVTFTISPRTDVTTFDTICNSASIVFDLNDPIQTPAWCNTIDGTPPTSRVLALPAVQPSTSFTVEWTGNDVGSGVLNHSVFVSINGGRYAPWIEATAETSASFTGHFGSRYAFYSVARDLAGNAEPTPTEPDTVTLIDATVPATATPTPSPSSAPTPTVIHTPTGPTPSPRAACAGDCDGGGDVTVNELVTGVNVALGLAPPERCPAMDTNGDGSVTIDEILRAVNAALFGCRALPGASYAFLRRAAADTNPGGVCHWTSWLRTPRLQSAAGRMTGRVRYKPINGGEVSPVKRWGRATTSGRVERVTDGKSQWRPFVPPSRSRCQCQWDDRPAMASEAGVRVPPRDAPVADAP